MLILMTKNLLKTITAIAIVLLCTSLASASVVSIDTLKNYFTTGSVPTQTHFWNLIDTMFSVAGFSSNNTWTGENTFSSLTLGGERRTSWPIISGGSAGSFWATTSNNLVGYPSLGAGYAITIGTNATTSNVKFEVAGTSKTTNLMVSALPSTLLATDNTGKLIATSTPTTYQPDMWSLVNTVAWTATTGTTSITISPTGSRLYKIIYSFNPYVVSNTAFKLRVNNVSSGYLRNYLGRSGTIAQSGDNDWFYLNDIAGDANSASTTFAGEYTLTNSTSTRLSIYGSSAWGNSDSLLNGWVSQTSLGTSGITNIYVQTTASSSGKIMVYRSIY